ncbi:MAG TPA: hypothetical protein VMT11_19745 [Myxococcaceae bacterium]|nr:hypothetical protein [Myxococcaceae bacterium]
MRILVVGLLLLMSTGCASMHVCGAGAGPGSCYEPSTGKSTAPPTTTGNQENDDVRRQTSGKP